MRHRSWNSGEERIQNSWRMAVFLFYKNLMRALVLKDTIIGTWSIWITGPNTKTTKTNLEILCTQYWSSLFTVIWSPSKHQNSLATLYEYLQSCRGSKPNHSDVTYKYSSERSSVSRCAGEVKWQSAGAFAEETPRMSAVMLSGNCVVHSWKTFVVWESIGGTTLLSDG
jgi:hypothetical protein